MQKGCGAVKKSFFLTIDVAISLAVFYKFNGRTEWAFDPYPALLRWEKYR